MHWSDKYPKNLDDQNHFRFRLMIFQMMFIFSARLKMYLSVKWMYIEHYIAILTYDAGMLHYHIDIQPTTSRIDQNYCSLWLFQSAL